MARIRPLRVRPGSATAGCTAVAVLAAAALAGCSSHAPAVAATATATADSPQGMAAACSKPSTPFARFWYITTGPDQTIFYKGTSVLQRLPPRYAAWISHHYPPCAVW